jgi:hypothetical protein
MSSKTIIELTKEVAEEFLDKEYKALDYDHVPFQKFTIKYPMGIYLTKEQLLRDISEEVGIPIDFIKEHRVVGEMEKYLQSNLSVNVEIDPTQQATKIQVVDSYNTSIFEFHTALNLPLPLVGKNIFSKTPVSTAMGLLRMVGNIIDYITSPTVTVKAKKIREEKKLSNKKKGKKKKGSQKTYIYKTVYSIDHISEDYHPKRVYTRQTGSWKVRGFWRHYKNGKKVWIKEHIRGQGKENSKVMKITKLDSTNQDVLR